MKANSSYRVVFIRLVVVASLVAATTTILVHLYVERPTVPWRLETGTFTIDLGGWIGGKSPEYDLPRPDEPNLAKLCRGVIETMLPRKCKETKFFELWCRSGPWYPRGWPFISQDHGFLGSVFEADCRKPQCPKIIEQVVGHNGKSRFLLGGFLANLAIYFPGALLLSTGVYAIGHNYVRRRMKQRRGFPVIPVSADATQTNSVVAG